MHNKHSIFTLAYHYFSEAIIIFFLSIPYFHYYFDSIPFWHFLLIATCITIVFSLFEKFTSGYKWFFISSPIIFVVFYLFEFPNPINVFYTILLTWRYPVLKQKPLTDRERTYIVLTAILATLLFLLTRDNRIIFFTILQFTILIIGNISSHSAFIYKERLEKFQLKVFLYYATFLALGAFLSSILIFIGKKGWEGLIYLLSFDSEKLMEFLAFLDVDFKLPEQETEPDFSGDKIIMETENKTSLIGFINETIANYIGISLLIIVCILFLVFLGLKIKNSLKPIEKEDIAEMQSYATYNGNITNKMTATSRLKNFFQKPNHPVRKMVYLFEREALKRNKGRRYFETIEEWLERIGIKTNITVYQKVRYGQSNVSDEEVKALQEQLNEMKVRLKED